MLSLVVLALPLWLAAQDSLRIRYYGTDQGLLSREVYGSVADPTGLLWLAGRDGLYRIDGQRVSTFTDQTFDTADGMVYAPDGRLYLSSPVFPDSLRVFDPATLGATGVAFGRADAEGLAGFDLSPGQYPYLVRGDGVYRFRIEPPGPQPQLARVFTLPFEAGREDLVLRASDQCYVILDVSAGVLHLETDGRHRAVPLPSYHPIDHHFHHDRAGRTWVSSPLGTWVLDDTTNVFSRLPTTLPPGQYLNFFAEDRAGHLFVGFRNFQDRRLYSLYEWRGDGLRDASWIMDVERRIISISGADFSRNLRLNSYGGLFLLQRWRARDDRFRRYLYRDVLPGKFGHVLRGFTADDDGNVYANKDSRDPYWFRVAAGTHRLDTLLIRDNAGRVVDQYGCGTNLLNYGGDIYGQTCGYDQGRFQGHIYRYSPANDRWRRWALPDSHQVVRYLTKGPEAGQLLAFTENKTDYRRGNIYAFYPARDSLVRIRPGGPEFFLEGYSRAVVHDAGRRCYWVGTGAGLYRFDPGGAQLSLVPPPETGPLSVASLQLTDGGQLLLGTLGAGLYRYAPDAGTYEQLGRKFGNGPARPEDFNLISLPSNDLAGTAVGATGGLLMTTFNGLAYHDEVSGATSVFTQADGLTNNEFNTPSLYHDSLSGRWYAGTVNGFVSFREEDLRVDRSPYQTVVTGYRVLDRRVGREVHRTLPTSGDQEIVLAPSVVYCVLEFAIPEYVARSAPRYQTRLRGFDPDWRPPTTENYVRYTDLDPGTYQLDVRGTDGERRSVDMANTLRLVVLVPFYKTWWFRLLLTLFIVGVVALVFTTRLRRLRATMEQERRLQNLELRSLRQQLNPHFISNALNAIREYIRREDAINPARYLTDFSRMMRLFMESSRRRFISVTDEVELLKRYVSLEQLRFPGKFTAEFVVDNKIDGRMEEIPSLLLQPIVENAIYHGLRPLPAGGHLRVSIYLDADDPDIIVCEVSDNGVGHKIAARAPRPPGHVSRATEIMQDRQTLLARNDEIDLQITTTDLHPDREHTGTVVTVRIAGV